MTLAPAAPPTDLRRLPLADRLHQALDQGRPELVGPLEPADRRDRFLALQQVYALHLAPLSTLGDRVRLQGHPLVAELKQRLEEPWLRELEEAAAVPTGALDDPDEVHEALLDIAVADRVPRAYRWLSAEASWDELVHFLAVEGGPDGGFDDLVAVCQVGLAGEPKLEMARNYWDEMGNGDLAAVHTVLHDDLVTALAMPRLPDDALPEEALERSALNGLLATNRWLQPELVGSLGMTELQAGPRCRLVVKAL
ncbi:MAG: iron-containing redox enzyme family protein, partial [Mycobacteriales bacterium]